MSVLMKHTEVVARSGDASVAGAAVELRGVCVVPCDAFTAVEQPA